MSLSTHVLDASTGRPAVAVSVTLFDAGSTVLADGVTDADGRIKQLGAALPVGNYRLSFDTGSYFAAQHTEAFYPEVSISFTVADADAHYHVPLLLSPFAYSTYRGS